MKAVIPTAGKPLNAAVRAGFIKTGAHLSDYCRRHGIDRVYARDVLVGKRNGPKALALRTRLVKAAGVSS